MRIDSEKPSRKARSKPTAPAEDPTVSFAVSGLPEGKRAALELTESARDASPRQPGPAGEIFFGRIGRVLRWREPRETDSARAERGRAFLRALEDVLQRTVDPDEIDRQGEIPDEAIQALAGIGAFGIKIPERYGGLGLSQSDYLRAAALIGSHCGNTTALLSAHQSIGVPQPLLLFGTEEQKRKFLPRLARGEISAFALTERNAGSDPARIETRAEPTPDGEAFILNGEKLWCTNGTRAGLIVVMARTPAAPNDPPSRRPITAFILDMKTEGVEVTQRCSFMGLKALYNGTVRFDNVRIPRDQILLEEGKGLKVALTTLNTGRLTLPAACLGLGKRCLKTAREWASTREQWGAPIGKHELIAEKIGRMSADLFALEAMLALTSGLVDSDHATDVRIEAAMCKLWGTERAWEIVNETVQILGGRGFETAASLKARGEKPNFLERALRDSRINLIFEGTSEIMRLFLAREALDPHLKLAAPVLGPRLRPGDRAAAAARAGIFYAGWYPRQWLPAGQGGIKELEAEVRPHARYAGVASRRLARTLLHAMARHGPRLERRQALLAALVDAGTELFALTAACRHADTLLKKGAGSAKDQDVLCLLEAFAAGAKDRIETSFRNAHSGAPRPRYRLARRVLSGDLRWLEDGILPEDNQA